jgi:hypothetical protein
MDEMQLRFLTAQALYGKELQERNLAIRMLKQSQLSPADLVAVGIRLELALNCQDEYVRSAAAMLLSELAEQVAATPSLADGLLVLSHSSGAFPREAALRAIKRIFEYGRCESPQHMQAFKSRLEEARQGEGEGFAMDLFDES